MGMAQGYSIDPCLTIGLGRWQPRGYRSLMHTISSLRKTLGLATANQVRNRIEAIRDVLEPHLRRGPNNQILLTDGGLAQLRQLQELYDSGLRMGEASDVLRSMSVPIDMVRSQLSSGFSSNRTTPVPSDPAGARTADLQDEVLSLRARLADLERRLAPHTRNEPPAQSAWWATLREDLDAA